MAHIYTKTFRDTCVSVVHERGRGIAWRIWPGAHVLIDWLEKQAEIIFAEDVHVIEIGAGVGLVGLVCAALGAQVVTLTDLPEELDALTRSVESNSVEIQNRLRVMPLSFGCPVDPAIFVGLKTIIVGSELVYWESLFQPIADTLRTLLDKDEATMALIGYRIRVWKTEKRFWTKILGQVGLHAEVVGEWLATEEDGSSQKSDGQVVYEETTEAMGWNTRVYKITKLAAPVSVHTDKYPEKEAAKRPSKHHAKLGKTERKGRVR